MAHPKLVLIFLPLLLWQPGAEASALTREMGLHVMLESASSALSTLGDYTTLDPDGISNGSALIGAAGLAWSGNFNDTGWTYSSSGMFGGLALSMNLSGTLSGAFGSDIGFVIAGSGLLGTQPLLMNGTSLWLYDSVLDDYFDSNSALLTKIGANSWFGWAAKIRRTLCLLAELAELNPGPPIVPEVIAGPPVELTSVVSTGKKIRFGGGSSKCYLPYPVVLQSTPTPGRLAGLVSGAAIRSPLAQAAGPAPAFPIPIANFLDASNQGTLVQAEGGLDGDDMDNRYRSSGSFSGDSFSGMTRDVTEPTSLALTMLALSAAAMALRRRATRR